MCLLFTFFLQLASLPLFLSLGCFSYRCDFYFLFSRWGCLGSVLPATQYSEWPSLNKAVVPWAPDSFLRLVPSRRLKCMHITLFWCYSGKTDVGIESVAIGDFSAQAERCTVAETWILVWKMIVTALVPLIKVSLRHCLGTIRIAFKIYFFPLARKWGLPGINEVYLVLTVSVI